MKTLRIAVALSVVALVMLVGVSARADNLNKLTIVTFNEPVELPGNVVLQPGTYAFVVGESYGFRHLVRVFDKDRTHLYATVLAIPNYRDKATEETVVKFAETPAGNPIALKEWFYPGNGIGQEFVYPKTRAVELAKVYNQPVPAMPDEFAQELKNAPVKVEEPTGREVELAEVFDITPRHIPALMRAELPKTASQVPLIGLFGLLLVASGLVLRAYVKHQG